MGIEFTHSESSTLYGLLADSTTDIILKTDRQGFIRHASPAIARLGLLPPDMLIWPHILDLVDPSSAPKIRSSHDAAIDGRKVSDWIELCAVTHDGGERSFAAQMRSLADDRGRIYGTLTVMRCIEEMRTLEERLFEAEMTDQLTGLTNRRAFTAMLQHLVNDQAGGCLAVFDIDHFRTMNMRYGQSAGDRVLVAFADFLKELTCTDDILSRIGGESFGILLPDANLGQAEQLCQHIIKTLAGLGETDAPTSLSLTASAGLASIGNSLDATIKSAELAVLHAKARGRNCLAIANGQWLS